MTAESVYLDLLEGVFLNEKPVHHHFIQNEYAQKTYELLMAMHPDELSEIKLNKEMRRNLKRNGLIHFVEERE